MKLLIVEDESKIGDYLKQGLSEAGFVVDLARKAYDLLILDVMLPDIDGWTILKSLREADRNTPVLFLTARDTVDDRVKGLELGADDYLVKPFAFAELLARVRTLLRRGVSPANETTLTVADLELDLMRRCATRAGQRIKLTAKGIRVAGIAGAAPGRGIAPLPDRLPGLGHELRQRHQRH